VVVTLAASTNYTFFSASATVTIIDNDAPLVTIETVKPSMYERVPLDSVSFRVTRGGDIVNSSLSVNVALSGTAIEGTDHTFGPGTVFMNNGEGSVTFSVNPQDDLDVEGNETIIATITPDAA